MNAFMATLSRDLLIARREGGESLACGHLLRAWCHAISTGRRARRQAAGADGCGRHLGDGAAGDLVGP